MFKKLSSMFRKSSADKENEPSEDYPVSGSPSAATKIIDHRTLYRLLLDNFTEAELMNQAQTLNVDYRKLPGTSFGAKSRELIVYLQRRGRLDELLAACKQARPNVDWSEVRVDDAETIVSRPISTKSYKPPRDTRQPKPAEEISDISVFLLDELSKSELIEICFDAGIEFEDFPGLNYASKTREFGVYLEKYGDDPRSGETMARIVAACTLHRPDVDWAEALRIDIRQITAPVFLNREGYKTYAIRKLLLNCFVTYKELNGFCQKHFAHAQQALSVTMPLPDSVQELIGYCIRRGLVEELLDATREVYPDQYDQFGPYTID